MITLAFRFPGGRYHATPWGHQVNEGQVEWPPCPWRILRAFLSCGHTRLGWTSIPDVAKRLVETLAASLPEYHLPSSTLAHSRHYMPLQTGKTTLVMDTWLNIEGELQVRWPVDLDPDALDLLKNIASAIGYLGRSESWVEARVLEDDFLLPINCKPHQHDDQRSPKQEELVTVLTTSSAKEYLEWRSGKLPAAETTGKKPTAAQTRARQKQEAPFPDDLVDALQWDTVRWKGFGWSQPPGSRWVQYRRTKVSDAPRPTRNSKAPSGSPLPDTVLLALATASGNASALPTVARTLPQAELIHRSLVSQADQGQGAPEVLTGRSADGQALSGNRHTHILPVDLDQDGHIDHILLWAPMGFSSIAMAAIRRVRKTWTKGGGDNVRLAVAGHGLRDRLQHEASLEEVLASAPIWRSVTPFVPPRFLKTQGKNSLAGQIRSELAARGLPHLPEDVEVRTRIVPEPGDLPPTQLPHFRHFIRRRSRGGVAPPQDLGFFVELRFQSPVPGPICLGYGAHFGMGRFEGDELIDPFQHMAYQEWQKSQTPGSWIAGLREAHAWSRELLASKLGGVSEATIEDWESNHQTVDPGMAERLAELLHIPASHFLPKT